MKFEIDRNRWWRGQEDGTRLVHPSNGNCCLGFFLLACRVPADKLALHGEPQEPFDTLLDVPEAARFLVNEQVDVDPETGEKVRYLAPSEEAKGLICANDYPYALDPLREEMIASIFARHGIGVTFTGPQRPTPGAEGGV